MSSFRARTSERAVGVVAATTGLLAFAGSAAAAALPSECSQSGVTVTCSYSSTGAVQAFAVPGGVSDLTITVTGAQGGYDFAGLAAGGAGGRPALLAAAGGGGGAGSPDASSSGAPGGAGGGTTGGS